MTPPSPVQLVLALLLFTCLASFTWAMRNFFVKPERLTPGLRVTLAAGFVFALAHFVVLFRTPDIQPAFAGVAAALYCTALVLFWWTILSHRIQPLAACFSRDEQLHLVQHGPYRLVRHPFYCSYLLTWLGGAVAAQSLVLGLTFIVMFFLYLAAARSEESKFAASPLAEAYSQYQRSTGQFFPSPLKVMMNRRVQ